MSDNSRGPIFEPALAIFAALAIVVGIASIILYPLFRSVYTDGRVDYCYVESFTYSNPLAPNVVVYRLRGHVPWRTDRTLADNLTSLSAAREVASQNGCELH